MTPEETLWAEMQQAPLVACRCGVERDEEGALLHLCTGCQKWVDAQNQQGRFHIDGHAHCICGGTGEVRSEVYRAIERAITVPDARCVQCGHYEAEQLIHERPDLHPERHTFDGTGRVLRPQPGVMACHELATPMPGDKMFCDACGSVEIVEGRFKHGAVPDPSEAGVVARDEACGRFLRVWSLLGQWNDDEVEQHLGEHGKQYHDAWVDLYEALLRQDYNGVLAAALEAVRALAAQGAKA